MSERGEEETGPSNFVEDRVAEEVARGIVETVVTRFPPEPNGRLHIGHAKAILTNYNLAKRFGGRFHLRFDDTNPLTEKEEHVEAIKRDVRWLGCDWGDHLYFASDYFEQLHAWATMLIERSLAYVDSQSEDEIRVGRGSFHEPGTNSPYRDRSVEENLTLFAKMRAGELDDGAAVLRAKIDMASPDLKLRDPLMYRIRKVAHHRTGDAWPIYPMYDWAHGQSDAIEGISHSCCSLEFVNHHALYDWFLKAIGADPKPEQVEFGRVGLTFTVLSKRKLNTLVEEGAVSGWDDPRMPTLAGMRRRGYTPESIRTFCGKLGVSRTNSVVDVSLLEHAVREDLNARAPRTMAVLDPVKLVIENMSPGETFELDCPYHPEDPSFGSRKVPFGRELWVERADFMKVPMKKWYRLAPGREVRLRYAALVTCTEAIEDAEGNVVELRCTWDPDSIGGTPADGRKVRGTIHWVSARHAVDATVRLYDRLFSVERPLDGDTDFRAHLNPSSLEARQGAKLEPALATREPMDRVQFERLGYFVADEHDHRAGSLVFNRTITLRDSWAKLAKRQR